MAILVAQKSSLRKLHFSFDFKAEDVNAFSCVKSGYIGLDTEVEEK